MVVFENVITEVGGLWNRVTNNFVLPIHGMYFFHFTLMAGSRDAAAYIRRDLTNIQAAYAQSITDTGSAAVMLELTQYTQMSCWLAQGTIYGAGSYGPYDHFSGFLLYTV